ncbi:hypothetical protein ACMU_10510 [Actibacterium mucosum KCTC 23349]|uniref:Methyltransferase type 11 domain-containing protein n=1 Tax=Actibacterium mucosum KCTC 23349 TaxID=1454373 RepID=A0A037ZIA0_9RHOB|nr:class I SAM-dependent methyltransferase [Actibacterium mucosum]KAJ56175.1 hypothetical protein ACMU_10510 [Actibacterium mucosum KCTC 23349]
MTGRHVGMNRDYWNGMADDWVEPGRLAWGSPNVNWGIWRNPETEVQMLPEDMRGMDAIELGCGTAYIAAWMARRGAKVTGIDISSGQLATARELAAEHKIDLTLIEGNAEETGLPDASFDFAISEYGAAIWCDPDLWLREAWRLLRPGGRLVFLGNHPLVMACTPWDGAKCEPTLHRPMRDMRTFDWSEVEIDPGGFEFNLSHADWMKLFAEIGFTIDGYLELYAPPDNTRDLFAISGTWARDYPSEQVWKLTKPL